MGDERVNDSRIVQLDPQPTLAVRFKRPMATVDVGALMDAAMQRLGAVLAQASVAPAGPPYARFHAWGVEVADVEIGFPLAASLRQLPDLADCPDGEVGASTLPGGRVALTVHRGPYPTLGQAYNRLHDWIHAQGEEEGPGPWESYVDNPGEVADVSAVRTELLWPVAAK